MITVTAFFDKITSTVSYVASDPAQSRCAIIDSVLDYEPHSGRTHHSGADQILQYIRSNQLEVDWILETHAHADHLTAAPYLREKLGGKIATGSSITEIQRFFKGIFNTGNEFATDGSQFDRLFDDGDAFNIGDITVRVLHTPGHTPACLTYLIGDTAFVGDTLFMPDYGTARTDFPGGDAAALYRSIMKILALPDNTRLFLCHDYLPPGRSINRWETTVVEQRRHNVHVHPGISESEFVALRNARDLTLAVPMLLLPAVQVNIRAGQFPPAEANGVSYLKIPVDLL